MINNVLETGVAPTRIFHPFGDVEVRLFGRNGGETDWSIRNLNNESHRNPSGKGVAEFYKLQYMAAAAKRCVVYAPYPAFNAVICDSKNLKTEFASNDDSMVEADFPDNWSWVLFRGAKADGCEIPMIGAFFLASADCLTIVALSPIGNLICAHAGGRSLYDEQLVLTGKPSREHESVVDAIARKLGKEMPHNEFFITGGICGHHFQHSWNDRQCGEKNKKITEYLIKRWGRQCVWERPESGFWSLKDIIATQLSKHHVGRSQIACDDICTYSDRDKSGDHMWWSNRRAMDEKDGTELCRNGVLVFRKK